MATNFTYNIHVSQNKYLQNGNNKIDVTFLQIYRKANNNNTRKMTTKVTSDEKESLLLKIPPTVSIEVVEDTSSEEEYDEDEENVQQNSAVLQLGQVDFWVDSHTCQ